MNHIKKVRVSLYNTNIVPIAVYKIRKIVMYINEVDIYLS